MNITCNICHRNASDHEDMDHPFENTKNAQIAYARDQIEKQRDEIARLRSVEVFEDNDLRTAQMLLSDVRDLLDRHLRAVE